MMFEYQYEWNPGHGDGDFGDEHGGGHAPLTNGKGFEELMMEVRDVCASPVYLQGGDGVGEDEYANFAYQFCDSRMASLSHHAIDMAPSDINDFIVWSVAEDMA